MDKRSELELFDYLSRHPKFREWVTGKFDAELDSLVLLVDVEQLRRAQGRAALLQTMLKLLDAAPAAVARS